MNEFTFRRMVGRWEEAYEVYRNGRPICGYVAISGPGGERRGWQGFVGPEGAAAFRIVPGYYITRTAAARALVSFMSEGGEP